MNKKEVVKAYEGVLKDMINQFKKSDSWDFKKMYAIQEFVYQLENNIDEEDFNSDFLTIDPKKIEDILNFYGDSLVDSNQDINDHIQDILFDL